MTGYDRAYGARPLKRAIQRLIQDPLAIKILDGEVLHGDHVLRRCRSAEQPAGDQSARPHRSESRLAESAGLSP